MRLKIQEQSELNFISRIIQSRYIGIGNYPRREATRDVGVQGYQKRKVPSREPFILVGRAGFEPAANGLKVILHI